MTTTVNKNKKENLAPKLAPKAEAKSTSQKAMDKKREEALSRWENEGGACTEGCC